ncbi:AAA family ATPase [Methylobacterium sp. E-041]|uniref:AAA family ATPase n=1 Tax=Methylobacterium sp. E-041 TaxID=2836573 RepID=UPI001FBBD912|nr:AAA family ATPase [Methylobacterium sp. E-041]MCJ2109394.1 AAA family ATPase [Methylobacterium sp. E-041]
MRCFIVGADSQGAARLGSVAADLGFTVSTVAAMDALRIDKQFLATPRALVLLADSSLAFDAADFAVQAAGQAFVVLVADTVVPEAYKALVRSGSGEWIQWGSCEAELAEVALSFSAPAHSDGGARVVSFLPSKGGVGNTTLVIEAAVHLSNRLANSRRGGGRVAVLDLNLQGGTLADCLDVEPRFDIAEIIGRPERLDEQLIEVFTSRYANRLDIFASPMRASAAEEVGPGLIFTFIDAISARYDAILLDLPETWLAWTDTLIQGSDAVVVTGTTTVPALRRLSLRLAHVAGLGVPEGKRAVAVNQVCTDLFGRFKRRPEIERVLDGHRLFFVRRDGSALEDASDSGRPLLESAPDSRVGRDIRRLATWIEGLVAGSAAAAKGGEADARETDLRKALGRQGGAA